MRSLLHSLVTCVLIVFSLVCSAAAHAQIQLKLEARLAQNFGVRTELLRGSEQAAAHMLDARVLDPSTLYAQLDELQMSNNAFALSSAQAARITRLYRNQQNATQAALAQATLAVLGDQKNLALAKNALRASWGDVLVGWSAKERALRLVELRSGRASLVRVELDAALNPETAFSLGAAKLERIGVLPAADPQTGRAGALLWLTPGMPAMSRLQLTMHAPGAGTPARVLIPRTAILRLNGGSFVFIQNANDAYAMRELIAPEFSAEGWLVQSGFAIGERVVTAGAASLLTLARGAGPEEE